MENTFANLKKIGELAVAAATISFIFYFIGFANKAAYYASLGISSNFLDFSYQQYVVFGVLNSIFFICYAPIFMNWYAILCKIKKAEQVYKNAEKEINLLSSEAKASDSYTQIQIEKEKTEIHNAQSELDKFKSWFHSRNPFKIISWKNLVTLVALTGITLGVSYYEKDHALMISVLAQTISGTIVCLLFFNQIRNFTLNKVRSFHGITFVILVIIFFLPVFSGYVDGIAKSRDNYFPIMNVTTLDSTITKVGLVGYGNNTYIFRSGKKNIFIETSEIKRMDDY